MKCPLLLVGAYACPEPLKAELSDCLEGGCAWWIPPLEGGNSGACTFYLLAVKMLDHLVTDPK